MVVGSALFIFFFLFQDISSKHYLLKLKDFQQMELQKSVSDEVAICLIRAHLNRKSLKAKFIEKSLNEKKKILDVIHNEITYVKSGKPEDICKKKKREDFMKKLQN